MSGNITNMAKCDRCGKASSLLGYSQINAERICNSCFGEELKYDSYPWASSVRHSHENGEKNFLGVLEDEQYCIMEFRVDGHHFKIVGDGIDIDEKGDLVFDNLFSFELNANNRSVAEYVFKPETFSGYVLKIKDILCIEISASTYGYAGLEIIHMHKKIEEFIHSSLPNQEVIKVGGREVPVHILYGIELRKYDLMFATNKYLYYVDVDNDGIDCVMLDVNEGYVISDNEFANNGVCDSITAVANGDEEYVYTNELYRYDIHAYLRDEGWKEKE